MYLLFCTDFYIFRNFVFFVFLVVQYRRSVIYKIKRLDTNTRDFCYILHVYFLGVFCYSHPYMNVIVVVFKIACVNATVLGFDINGEP